MYLVDTYTCTVGSDNVYMHCFHYTGDILASYSQRLFSNLQGGFWDRPKWKPLKQEVELLALQFPQGQKQKMFVLHQSTEPVRTVANSLSVQLISPRHTPAACLQGLSETLKEAQNGSPVSLQDTGLLPQDRRRRYEYIEHVKQGFTMPVVKDGRYQFR